MIKTAYKIDRREEDKVVEISLRGSSLTFEQVRGALLEVKELFDKGYKVKIKGYLSRKSEAIEAFMFAVNFLGYNERVVFEEKAKYRKKDRKVLRKKAVELSKKGLSVKDIIAEINVPMKTVYRWLKEERRSY